MAATYSYWLLVLQTELAPGLYLLCHWVHVVMPGRRARALTSYLYLFACVSTIMAKVHEIGSSSIKKCLLLGISTRFS